MLLIWDITSFCNLNCIHCYNAEKYDGKRALGRELTIEESLEVVNHLEKAGFKEVLLLGGEPLLYPDLIRLIGYLKSKG